MMESREELLPQVSRENSRNSRSECSVPCRYSLAFLACLGFCVVYALRVNLSVALVAMVNSTYSNGNAESQNPECGGSGNLSQSSKVSFGSFYLFKFFLKIFTL